MVYYLGIDVGTTSAKAVAFSEDGRALASYSCTYKMYHPQPGWSEQNPEEVFQAVLIAANKVITSLPGRTPLLVAFSAAMHSLLIIDKTGQPLTNCIIWADNRAGEIAEDLKNTEWGRKIYHNTGVPIHAMSPLCKLIWLKQYERDTFIQADKFISIKEYIFFKFFKEFVVDTSIASATGLLNLKSLVWDDKILNFLGITTSSLSNVVSTKSKYIYTETGATHNGLQCLIPLGTSFIIGGSDGAMANLGTGAIDDHSMAISIGTSGAARVVVESVETDMYMRTFCYHVKDHQYIIGGPSNNGAVVLEWLKDNLLETTESFDDLFQRAGSVKAGSEDLIFVPYILGERAPVWNSKAKGIYFGLSIRHTKAHLIRACMEGVIYSMYSIAKVLLEKKAITEIHATGGFVHSSLWLQMLADMCNIKVLVSGAVESSALGAVMVGIEAMELQPFPAKKIAASYEPNLLHHEIYIKSFERFERIYELLKDEITNEIAVFQEQLK